MTSRQSSLLYRPSSIVAFVVLDENRCAGGSAPHGVSRGIVRPFMLRYVSPMLMAAP